MGLALYLKFYMRAKLVALSIVEGTFLGRRSHHLQICKDYFRAQEHFISCEEFEDLSLSLQMDWSESWCGTTSFCGLLLAGDEKRLNFPYSSRIDRGFVQLLLSSGV